MSAESKSPMSWIMGRPPRSRRARRCSAECAVKYRSSGRRWEMTSAVYRAVSNRCAVQVSWARTDSDRCERKRARTGRAASVPTIDAVITTARASASESPSGPGSSSSTRGPASARARASSVVCGGMSEPAFFSTASRTRGSSSVACSRAARARSRTRVLAAPPVCSAEAVKSPRSWARSRGRACVTAIRITSAHCSSTALRTSSPKSPSSTAARAPR